MCLVWLILLPFRVAFGLLRLVLGSALFVVAGVFGYLLGRRA
jgi:hypothetical protein